MAKAPKKSTEEKLAEYHELKTRERARALELQQWIDKFWAERKKVEEMEKVVNAVIAYHNEFHLHACNAPHCVLAFKLKGVK